MANFINMTPHKVVLLDDSNKVIRIFESEGLIRLKADTVRAGLLDKDIPLSKTVFGEPQGLPDYNGEDYFIVSQLVKTALPNRADLVVPAEVQRDENGNIIGCRSFGV